MRAVEYYTNNDIRIVDLPVPVIGSGELLVQLRACGICASDTMEWYMQPRAPLYPGHEPVGIVAAIGDGVTQFAVGQRVFLHHHVPCMLCHSCQRGSFSQCATFHATRLYPGGLAEYIRVPPLNVQGDVLSLPNDISFEAATLIEPLACCIRGIERAGVQAGDCVCILGAGSNGLMLAQLAQQRGASCVIMLDPIAYRRQHAIDMGIDFALDPSTDEAVQAQLQAINDGRKPDIVIVTPSKMSAMQQGIELVGPGGTVLLFAPLPPDEILPVLPNMLFFREITLCTSYSAGPYETRLALELLRRGRIQAKNLITHRFGLHDAAQAFELVARPGNALKVVILPEDAMFLEDITPPAD